MALRLYDRTNWTRLLCFIVLVSLLGGCKSSVATPRDIEALNGYVAGPPSSGIGDTAIVFIHGVTGNAITSWTNPETHAYFPKMLGEEIPSTSIYRVAYYSPKFAQASTISQVASRTLQKLRDDQVFTKHKKVYFIAHSMGGLVTKAMLVELSRPNQQDLKLLDKVRAAIFLSVPSQGAPIAGYTKWLTPNPQVGDMATAETNSYLQHLEKEWQSLLRDRDELHATLPKSFCAYETLRNERGILVVDMVYANTRCDVPPYPLDVSHGEIAQPPSKQHEPFKFIVARIQETNSLPGLTRNIILSVGDQATIVQALPNAADEPKLLDVAEERMASKDDLLHLSEIENQIRSGEHFPVLTIRIGPNRVYRTDVVAGYVQALADHDWFKYVVFLDDDRFLGWMKASRFISLVKENSDRAAQLINSANVSEFRMMGMHDNSLDASMRVSEALTEMTQLGVEASGIVDSHKAFRGMAGREELLAVLLNKATASLVNSR